MSDYPEYLNPFERSSVSRKSITASFREFKHKIRSSFRIKKKTPAAIENNEVQLRKETRQVPGTLKITNRAPVTSLPPQSTATLNPRSRFEERVRKSSIPDIDQLTLPRRRSCFSNPFEDESPRSSTSTAPRRVYKTRRAPLPPTSTSNQNLSEMSKPHNLSKWSLTSVDTDCSYDRRSDETFDEQNASGVQKEFEQFTSEMSKLTESASREKLNIPDLVVSCPSQRCSEENLAVDKIDEQLTKETVGEPSAAETIIEDSQKCSKELNKNTDIQKSPEENLATDETNKRLTKETDEPTAVEIIANEDLQENELNKDVKESSEETLEIAQINPTNENNVVENTTTEELNEATTVNNKENKEITLIPEDATESNLNTEKENNVIENIGEVETDANTATKNEQPQDEITETNKMIENGAIVVDENANHNGDITENNKTPEEEIKTNNNHEENEDDRPFNRKDIKSMIFIDEDEICNEKNKSNDEKPDNPPVPKMRKKKLTKKHFLGLLSLKS